MLMPVRQLRSTSVASKCQGSEREAVPKIYKEFNYQQHVVHESMPKSISGLRPGSPICLLSSDFQIGEKYEEERKDSGVRDSLYTRVLSRSNGK